jgi:hypothetical protein
MGNCSGDTYDLFSTCFTESNNNNHKTKLKNKKIINKNQKTNIKNIYIIKNETPITKKKANKESNVTHF